MTRDALNYVALGVVCMVIAWCYGYSRGYQEGFYVGKRYGRKQRGWHDV